MDTNLHHTCTGGCGTAVSDPRHPCDTCWDRLPSTLKRDLLLSLAGVEINTAVISVAEFFGKPLPQFLAGDSGLRVNQPRQGETTP